MKNIVYAADVMFPKGEASSNRVALNILALAAGNYEVRLIARERGRACSELEGTITALPAGARVSFVQDATNADVRNPASVLAAMAERQVDSNTKAIILTGGYGRLFSLLRRVSLRRRVPLVTEVMEWFANKHFRHGVLNKMWLRTQFGMYFQFCHSDGIIAISRYLENYYKKRVPRVVRIPPLINVESAQWPSVNAVSTRAGALNLVFIGSWTRERWNTVLTALAELRAAALNIHIHVCGGRASELLDNARCRGVAESLTVHDRLPEGALYALIAKSDFGLLLRDDERWSRACFPSKLPEIMACGTPMLCNLTSDLEEYLEDGYNSLLVPNARVDAFVATIKRAAGLADSERESLHTQARETSRRFHYAHFTQAFGGFIEGVSAGYATNSRGASLCQ